MCAVANCPELAEPGRGRCAAHRQQDDRPNAARRGYGARWRRVRAMFLAAHPICCDPFGLHSERVVAALDVDHVVPLRRGGSNANDNLQPLCRMCHNHKTRLETRMAV